MKCHDTLPQDDLARARATRNPLRKLYYWTLHWAATPYALPALIILSFAESSFFPVPPDVLLIALCFCNPRRWLSLALWCTAASVVGGLLGYFIGWGLWETVGLPIVRMYHGEAVVEMVKAWYENFGFFGVLIAAVTPIPYKVFTIASGMMRFDLAQFVLASVLGRAMRFFLVAGLIRMFGARIKPFMERHFELAATALAVLAVLGFAAIKYLK
ncbi:YqaA family protein [Desulfomicrobium escambiense]|uniref:YqaA family protein n=1 Tax=Desulfomicrobium escambiense TaxID=29503 RepID=UPI0003FDD0E7|nr:YqaA family protein [Desulfomicrobium escambiense]